MYQFHTLDKYDYQQFTRNVDTETSVSLAVAACNDAHLILFNHHLNEVAYEIVIGGSGNQFTIIRRQRLENNKAEVCICNADFCCFH